MVLYPINTAPKKMLTMVSTSKSSIIEKPFI